MGQRLLGTSLYISLQLPIYLYLFQHKQFKHFEIIGFGVWWSLVLNPNSAFKTCMKLGKLLSSLRLFPLLQKGTIAVPT